MLNNRDQKTRLKTNIVCAILLLLGLFVWTTISGNKAYAADTYTLSADKSTITADSPVFQKYLMAGSPVTLTRTAGDANYTYFVAQNLKFKKSASPMSSCWSDADPPGVGYIYIGLLFDKKTGKIAGKDGVQTSQLGFGCGELHNMTKNPSTGEMNWGPISTNNPRAFPGLTMGTISVAEAPSNPPPGGSKLDTGGNPSFTYTSTSAAGSNGSSTIKACGGIFNYFVKANGDCVEIPVDLTHKDNTNQNYLATLTSIRPGKSCSAEFKVSVKISDILSAASYTPGTITLTNPKGCDASTYKFGIYGATPQNINIQGGIKVEQPVGVNTCKTDPSMAGCQTDPNADPQCGADTTPLSWIICPIFNAVESAGDAMNSVVTNQLEVDTCSTFNSGDKCNSKDASTSDAYKGAWSAMRNIALIIIVIAGLVMIIAQAIGSQAVDAYTIKSVMPRLLIAAILISLSWIIMDFFVNLSNILGEGIRVLIYSPFSGLAHSQSPVFTGQNVITLFFGGIAIVGGILILLAFAGTVFLALLIGFLVVVLRQLVLVFLIIIAPIAIALYALPNTQKIFSMWWDNFIKLLMMFPIMVGFIAVGRVFSAVSLQQGGFVNTIIATVAYILPFFLLPLTFKFAGGAMGGIAQGLHGFGQKVNAGIKKRRGERWAGRRERFKNGELLSEQTPFKSLNKLGGRVNKIGAGVGHGGFWGAYGMNKLGKANLERLQSAQRDERLKKPGAQDLLQDDDVRMALFSGGVEEAQELINRMVASGGMTKEKGAQVMAAAKSIGFDSASRLAAWRMEAAQGKGRALTKIAKLNNVDDNTQMSSIVGSIAEDTGVDQDRLLQDTMFAFGQGARVDLRQQSLADVTKDRFDTRTVSALAPRGMERLTKYMTDDVGHTGLRDSDRSVRMRTAAQLLATQESLTMMAEPTRKAFTDRMTSAGVFNYQSSTPREFELAKQVDQQLGAEYDTANSYLAGAKDDQAKVQQRFDEEVARDGKASDKTKDELDAAKVKVKTAAGYLQPHLDALNAIATEIRGTSSTYGQSMPYGARDAVLQDQQQQQQPPPGTPTP